MQKTMKLVVLLALGVAATAMAQENPTLAKVQSIDGKQVYVLNQPLRQYEVVGEVKTGVKFLSLLTRGIISEDIAAKSAQFTRKAIRKYDKKAVDFDAVLYTGGRSAHVVRFTNPDDQNQNGIAVVSEVNGLTPFVLAEPMFDYVTERNVSNLISLRSFFTYGFWNNSIEQDTKGFAKKANRKVEDANYIAYDTGKRVTIISPID
ncbi:MAG: hypothetical protein AAGC88_16875 [Bacteroidota bacterium]